MEDFAQIVGTVDGWVWGWSPVSFLPPVLVMLLFGTGLYLTIGTRFLSIRLLPKAIGLLFRSGKGDQKDGEISPAAALFTALSATIGTGNIAGVATAITLGGPGAVFWMWMTAVFGMATKYSEALLAVRYRETDARGKHVGGPMYYIKNGLGKNFLWLAWLFAIFLGVAAFGTGNLVQSNSVAALFNSNVPFPDIFNCREQIELLSAAATNAAGPSSFHALVCQTSYPAMVNTLADNPDVLMGVPTVLAGGVVAALVFVVIIGGIESIARVASVLVPFMAAAYIIGALVVLSANAPLVPGAFMMIIDNAFTGSAAAGGFLGAAFAAAIREGANRGSFSNEAGLGSAAIAHAAARTHDPHKQGLIAMLGTFIDTLLVCTMTALVILTAPSVFTFIDSSGAAVTNLPAWQSGIASAADVTAQSFGASIPHGEYIVTFGLMVFAFTTILGWAYYGERAMEFMFGIWVIKPYRVMWCVVVFAGAVWTNNLAWGVASIGNGMMAAPNLIALLGLSGVIFSLSRKAEQGAKLDAAVTDTPKAPAGE